MTDSMGPYEQYIHKSRYARYLPEKQRRETWPETVARYIEFFRDKLDSATAAKLEAAILNLDVMPSMRALMTAGEALERDNVAGFNCSYLPIDNPRAFDELMFILLCGTGVGFSVERQYVNKMPEVAEEFFDTETVIQVADSKIGWAKSFRELISLLYSGQVPKWDVSKVRPAGEPLKTFGGRSSGPDPLVDLFKFTVEVFKKAAGRKLSSIECHDLCCKVADIVVVGGVRRSALISLSNLTDDRMRRAKSGEWWMESPHRGLANNSVCYTEKPDFESFLAEWTSLFESKSGERGLFSRPAAKAIAARNGRRDPDYDFGTNPCSEIILRPNQFCNLSEIVLRSNDTRESFLQKVEIATILGTLQATLTNFRYLRKCWADNTQDEALLGVSITGVMDNTKISGDAELLAEARELSIAVNETWAAKLGINQSTAITCVKPSGTVSQLVNSASGCHPRFSKYYVRRVRADKRDPMSTALIDAGVPYEEDKFNPATWVFSFPMKAPARSVTTSEMGAMEQLRVWSVLQEHWCEHKPSITVYYKDSEFLEIGQWVYNNFDTVSGISFLPYSDHSYVQAPYEEIDEKTYKELLKTMPKTINWDINEYEDMTEGAQNLACVAGACEV
jgi:ribonucleoside-triphosphate reductase (thioredoxin)